MDSTPAACAASPEWYWFWFWFGLLVLVNVATEIALCTIAATTRHLLVCLTSLGHHNVFSLVFCLFSSHSTVFSSASHFAPSDKTRVSWTWAIWFVVSAFIRGLAWFLTCQSEREL